MRSFILLPIAIAVVAAIAWVQAGADRYDALRRQGDALLGVLREAAEETAQTLEGAEQHLAERLLAVARRADSLIEHTRRPAAEVLQQVADEDLVGRLFLVDAQGRAIARAQFPRPVDGQPGLIDAAVHGDLDWERTLQSVRSAESKTGAAAVEGMRANVFGTRDHLGVMLKREDGGTLVVRENADRLAALRKRFGLPPVLQRLVEVPDVAAVKVVHDGIEIAAAGQVGDPKGPPTIQVQGPISFGQRADANATLYLSTASADAAVTKSRNMILLASLFATLATLGAALFVAHREHKQRLASARRNAAQEEQRRLAEMGALAGLVTHEISNPMNSIRLGVEMLSSMPAGADTKPVLDTIGSEAERVGRTLENFMRLATPQTQAEVVPASVLLDAVERVRAQADAKGVPLTLTVAGDAPPVRAHRITLEQALANLLRNAVEATPAGSPVLATWRAVGASVHVLIEDSGPGFPDDVSALTALGSTSGAGHGLGIPLAKRFVEAHGGRLLLENGDHAGACVRVELRVAQASDDE